MQSKYQSKINVLTENQDLKLHGDRLLVEVLEETEKKTASGIVIASDVSRKNPLANNDLAIVRVLAVGEGYYTEKNGKVEFVALTNKPGDNILISTHGIVTYKDFFLISGYKEHTIGLVSQENVHATIGDIERFLETLKN